jgi:hypothetical protein
LQKETGSALTSYLDRTQIQIWVFYGKGPVVINSQQGCQHAYLPMLSQVLEFSQCLCSCFKHGHRSHCQSQEAESHVLSSLAVPQDSLDEHSYFPGALQQSRCSLPCPSHRTYWMCILSLVSKEAPLPTPVCVSHFHICYFC